MIHTIAVAHAGFDRHELSQHRFALASIYVDGSVAATVTDDVRKSYPEYGSEPFEPGNLTRTGRGRKTMTRVCELLEGRYLVTVRDKRPAFAAAIGTHVLEPLHRYWDEAALAEDARQIVEDAALERMIESGASSDAICGEVDLLTLHLDPRLAATLFDMRVNPEFGVLDRLQRFMWADDEKLYELCGRRSVTPLEDGVWLKLYRSAFSDHLRSWLTRHPCISATVAEEAILRTISTYCVPSDRIEIPLHRTSNDDAFETAALTLRTVSRADAIAMIAKIVAVAAVYARNHADDPSFERLNTMLDRHEHDALPEAGDRLQTEGKPADSAERLGMILKQYGAHVGWGAPIKGYGDRRRAGRI